MTLELKEQEWDDICQKVICSGLRDKIFLPMALQLLNYDIVPVPELPMGHPACVVYELNKIFINTSSDMYSRYVKSKGNLEELMTFVLFHEVLHPQLLHWKRQKNRDGECWNISCDFFINGLLRQLEREQKSNSSRIVKMNVDSIDGIMIHRDFDGQIEEEIYDILQKNGHFKKEEKFIEMEDFLDSLDQPGDGDADPDSEDDGDGGQEQNDKESKGQSPSKPELKDSSSGMEAPVKITKVDFSYGNANYKNTQIELPQPDPSKMSEEQQKAQSDRNKADAMANKMLENALLKGDVSSDLKKMLSKLFKVKIDWEKILKDSILTALEKADEQSWGIPDPAWLANPMALPYLPTEKDEEVLGDAIFAIDESGSMSDEDVQKGFSIVVEAWEHYKRLIVMKHDTRIKWTHVYDEKPTKEEIKQLTTRRSYGGTSHKEVFDKLFEFWKADENSISIFIGVSDMCSDIETSQDLAPHQIPRVWIVNSDYQVPNLVGRVIRLK